MSQLRSQFSFRVAVTGLFLGLAVVVVSGISGVIPGVERLFTGVVSAEVNTRQETEKGAKASSSPERKNSGAGSPEGKLVFGRTNLEIIFGIDSTENSTTKPHIFTRDPLLSAASTELTDIEEYEPAYSPDGSKIVFVSRRDSRPSLGPNTAQRDREIYIMNSDGSSQRRLTFNDTAESNPSFSPDGTKILYNGSVINSNVLTAGIYTMNLDGTDQQLIIDSEDFDGVTCPENFSAKKLKRPQTTSYYPGFLHFQAPNFNADGSKIIFGVGSIAYTMNADGSGCQVFYQSPEAVSSIEPRFSPDGSQVVLLSAVNENDQIIRSIQVLTDAGAPVYEVQLGDYGETPVWSPDGTKIAWIDQSLVTSPAINVFDPINGGGPVFVPEADFPFIPYFHGLAWEIPSSAPPPISIKFNEPHPISAGGSLTATVSVATAPESDVTVQLSTVAEPNVVSLPQTAVVIPANQTQATFQIDTTSPLLEYKSADVIATLDTLSTRATMTISPSRPDLRAVSFTAPASFVPGQQFSVSWTVDNIGAVSTGTGYTDYVLLSTDNAPDDNDLQFGTTSQAALAAGASRTTPRNLTINGASVPQGGLYYLIFVTNPGQGVNEDGRISNNFIAHPIQANLPDVVAENIVTPATIEPGISSPVQWTIRNQGTAATAGTFENILYFSADNIAGNADDLLIGTRSTSALAAGATVVQSLNVNIPTVPVRPTGEAFFYVTADYLNTVPEGTAGNVNNTSFQSVQFNYNVPDLQVTATSTPNEVDSDTPFAIEWTDTNAGNRNAGAFTDKVYFSLDNQIGADLEIGSFALSGGLAAATSAERIQNVTIPTNALPVTGDYFVYVRTDTANTVNEGVNENNNVRFHPVRVRRLLRPDLTVTNITAPNASFFDQTIQVQWTVTNSGQGPTNAPQWKDKVFLHTAQTTNGAFLVAQSSSISALNSGESYIASATFKIPRGYNGSYVITVKTDSDGALNEENTGNNTLTRPIQINVPPLPDLVIDNVQVPVAEAFGGQELLVNYTIRNQGTKETAGWRDRVYLSRDTTLNTSQDRLIFTGDGSEAAQLDPDQTITLTTRNLNVPITNPREYINMLLPSDASGLWYVFVVADYRNDVYEFTNENNNVNYDSVQPGAPLNILVTPPDLVVENPPTASDSANSGQSFSVGFTVKNQGAFAAAPFLYHGLYLSTDQTFDAGDTLLGTIRDENSLLPGGEHPLTMNAGLPQCLADGTYYIFAVADSLNRQFELDPNFDAEANNVSPPKAIQVTTVPPDLQVTDLQVSQVTQPGQPVTVSWTVTNAGPALASGTWNDVLVLRSTNPQIASQTLLSIPRTGGLQSGLSYLQTRTLTLPAYMEGEYYLSVITDSSGTVSECGASENNNQVSSPTFTVQNNLPDLVIDSVTAPQTAVVGASFNVDFNGRNLNGAMPANSPAWSDYIYLSPDPNLSNSDRYLGAVTNASPLASNQTYQQQLQVSSGNISPGTYYILVVADRGRHIYEGAPNTAPESNNLRASTPITLTTPSVDLQVGNVSVAAPFYSGTYLTISWTVSNSGATPTLGANWSDYAILSRDGIIDPTDRVLGYVPHTGALAGGASYNGSGSFLIPNGLTGDYRVFIITDYSNNVIETDNSNNTSLPFSFDLTLPPPADLNITNITPPVTVNLGENAQFNWTVQNSGTNPVLGIWRDTIYLSRDTFWDSSDILVAQHDLNSNSTPVPAGGTYTTGTNVTLSSVEEGTYYVIVRTDAQNRIRESNEANNVSNATAITTVTITELPLNTPFNTALENGGIKFFKFAPQPLETILMTLTTDTPSRSNELLTNFGTIVSRADFDFQGDRPGEGNQRNFISETDDGQYFSMVRTDLIPESFAENFGKASGAKVGGLPAQNITVTAQVLPFSIREVSPTVAGNQGDATVYVEGAKFAPGATVKLFGADNSVLTPRITKNSKSRIVALFDLRGKAAGDYDVVVTNPNDQTTSLADGFEIVNGGGHNLRHSATGPRNARIGNVRSRFTFTVNNDGLNDAIAVPLMISFPTNVGYDLDRSNYFDIPGELLPQGMPPMDLTFDRDGKRLLFLIAPIIRSKESINVNIDFTLTVSDPMKVGFGVMPPILELLQGAPPTPEEIESLSRSMNFGELTPGELCLLDFSRAVFFAMLSLFPGASCNNLVLGLVPIIDNLSGLVMGIIANDNVLTVDQLFTTGLGMFLGVIDDIGQCAGNELPYFKLANAVWTIGNLIKTYIECILKEYEYDVTRPFALDPNEKIGPTGYSAEQFVPVGQPLLYRINFENVATATAPAQRVSITDVLPPTLDLRTVRIREIGFKQNRYIVPESQSFYQSRVQLGEDLNNLKADIIAGVDLFNGRIFLNLTAIDPQTGEQPTDPLLGLLPPNNENNDGEGYVEFTVEAKASFPNRTQIENSATIVFDENEAIITNTTSNLLDSVVPTSVIAPLPATTDQESFVISWSGTDDSDGSGLRGYDIYVAEDGGAYLPLITRVAETSTTFVGKWGKTYRFYSIASDNAGNIENAPVTPDAEITVRGGDTEADVSPRPDGNDGQVSADDTAQVRRFAAGLDSDLQFNELQRADAAPLADGGDGVLSVADVMQTNRYALGLDATRNAAGPNEPIAFNPKTKQGKSGLGPQRTLRPVAVNRTGNKLNVAVELLSQADETGVGFTLLFNTAHLVNPSNISLGTDAAGANLTFNSTQAGNGKLGILIDKAPNAPFAAGTRQILRIEFDIVTNGPPTTLIDFDDSIVKREVVDGTAAGLTTAFNGGPVSLLTPTSAEISVSGRVTANGRAVGNARVNLTGPDGQSRTVLTNTFGFYRFGGVRVGETYTIGVSAKGRRFVPRILTATDDLTDFNFEAQ